MPVDPARAALVQQPFRRVMSTRAPAGAEDTIVTALADQAGADAWVVRLGDCVAGGLARCVMELRDVAIPPPIEVGDVLLVPQDWPGVLAGRRVLVTGVTVRLGDRGIEVTMRGPLP